MPTQNRVLGKGEIYFDKFVANTTTKQGERYLGNTPEFTLTSESETLDHFDSDHGIRVKDDSVTLETNRSGNLITDNIDAENVALFFLGATEQYSQVATPVADEAITVKQGFYYQLGLTEGHGQGVRNVTGVVIQDVTDTTTYVLDTDYTLDAALGRIFIIEGGAISDDDVIHVDYTPAVETRTQIISSADTIEGAMRFVAFNPKGDLIDYYLPRVLLSPNGDYALKGDDWQQIGFSLEVLQLDDNTPAVIAQKRI